MNRMKIIIAEDDPSSLKMLAKFLAPYGEVICTRDGQDACDQAMNLARKNLWPGLVVLDYMMPRMNGIETLGRIRDYETRNEDRGVKASVVFLVTALSDSLVMLKAMDERCDAYFTKPLDLEALRGELARRGFSPDG